MIDVIKTRIMLLILAFIMIFGIVAIVHGIKEVEPQADTSANQMTQDQNAGNNNSGELNETVTVTPDVNANNYILTFHDASAFNMMNYYDVTNNLKVTPTAEPSVEAPAITYNKWAGLYSESMSVKDPKEDDTVACMTATPTPTPTNTPTPTDTPTPTNTPIPTNTPTPTNTPKATNTPTPAPTKAPANGGSYTVYDVSDEVLLTCLIYTENNSSEENRRATGSVILNRMNSRGQTMVQVITAKSQFGVYSSGKLERAINDYMSGNTKRYEPAHGSALYVMANGPQVPYHSFNTWSPSVEARNPGGVIIDGEYYW